MPLNTKPIALIILDGFGIAPNGPSNAISLANKPFFDSLIKNYPTMLLEASGMNVGLPEGEVGNSEVGHLSIGSGILRYQSLPRIDKSISTGSFFKLPELLKVNDFLAKSKGKLHLIGLVSNGGVHSSQEHLEALINYAKVSGLGDKTFIHAFLDGRDTAKNVGKEFISKLLNYVQAQKCGQIASLCGRFYGMDRNKNWDRIQKSYEAMVFGKALKMSDDPIKAIEESYSQNIFDEEFEPTLITKNNKPIATIEDGDAVIFFNFRADRGRQMAEVFALSNFTKFARKTFQNLLTVTFTEYEKNLPVEVLFPPEITENPIARIFSEYNLKQLHIAETEKYAHVTFFLNGMKEETFSGEERILVPSPSVISYDQKPEMSAFVLTNKILAEINKDKFDFLAINYANADMVGHTGNLKASVKAVETVDSCLAKIIPEIIKKGGTAFIVGDHGNAEEMVNPITGETDKEHNSYPVPFIIAGNSFAGQNNQDILTNDLSLLSPIGILADVTPTILKTAGLSLPKEMTGTCLV